MSGLQTAQPGIDVLADVFSPELAAEQAISVQMREAIEVMGGLASMATVLRSHDVHPAFADATEELVDRLEREALTGEIRTVRHSGTVEAAHNAMLERSFLPLGFLPMYTDLVGGIVAPIMYHSTHHGIDMTNGDLTVYRR